MVVAAEKDADAARQILGALLKRSSANTFPGLGDPLDIDFGAHRWLRSTREKSYSDWLARIINRQAKAERILPLFGIEAGVLASGAVRYPSSIRNMVPLPGALSTETRPWWSLTTDCTIARPRPVPCVLVV